MNFQNYWKEESAKRRKSWSAKARRFAAKHTPLEEIRQVAYRSLDLSNYRTYLTRHYTEKNPLVYWDGVFAFSEGSLREALLIEGADLSFFKMEVSRKLADDVKKELERRKKTSLSGGYIGYSRQLESLYRECSNIEMVLLTYKDISMVINRYTSNTNPFAYYEVIPCEQLTCDGIFLQETNFYTLNIATLLIEMAAEWELRQEEYNYYAKKLRVRLIETAVCDKITFQLWDEDKIESKMEDYIDKDYSLMKIYEHILRPWLRGVEKFMVAITERDMKDNKLDFAFNYRHLQDFVTGILRPYLWKQGFNDLYVYISENDSQNIIIEYKGFRLLMHCDYSRKILFYPYVFTKEFIEQRFCFDNMHIHFRRLTLSAVAEYLKQMVCINKQIDNVITVIYQKYNRLKWYNNYGNID